MKQLGYINAEGGPLLIMDASVSHSWKGIEGDGCDYKEACKLFDVNPSIEGGPISIDGETGMLWEMKGPGTADAFMNDHLVIVRTWPTNPSDTTASLYFANEPILGTRPVITRHLGA